MLGELAISDDVRATLARARREARAMRHAAATIEHVLLALADDMSVFDALEAYRVDAAGWTAELRAFLLRTAEPVARWRLFGPALGPDVLAVLATLHARITVPFRRRIDLPALVAAALDAGVPQAVPARRREGPGEHPYRARHELVAHPLYTAQHDGLRGVDVMAHVVHGRRCDPESAVAAVSGPARAIAFNDDYSPFTLVIELFCAEFGLARDAATRLAVQIDQQGYAPIATADGAELAPRVRRAIERARGEGMPLALWLEPLGS